VDELAPEEIQNRNEELAGRKARPIYEMRFKANNGGVDYH
jgi:hypothetical protein